MVTLTAPETFSPTAGTAAAAAAPTVLDLAARPVRELNQAIHNAANGVSWAVINPGGKHSLAVGIDADIRVTIDGHAGYYAAGMHQKGDVTINGNAGVG